MKRGWKQLDNGDIQLTMSSQDYDWLLFLLGYGTAKDAYPRDAIRLMNAINEGNPQFTPYEVLD